MDSKNWDGHSRDFLCMAAIFGIIGEQYNLESSSAKNVIAKYRADVFACDDTGKTRRHPDSGGMVGGKIDDMDSVCELCKCTGTIRIGSRG